MGAWDVGEVAIEHREISTLCAPDPLSGRLLVPGSTSHDDMTEMCHVLGGRLPSYSSPQELEALSEEIRVHGICLCVYVRR